MDEETVLNKLDELYQKINQLEQSIPDKNTPTIIIKLDVKDLHLQELKLEELAFHLEKLDIQDLSGMLNLGNTFSPVVHRKPDANSESPSSQSDPQEYEDMEKEKIHDIDIKINGKSMPFTID
ncbi:hypothetical protein [Peribacillus kribbensis]|uniref:hypothetical protein n=1 Tax=Peribacillus kribbensis TaxID=356658 RepID=UPI000418AF40|nr:hypothetical protein [Peribacillus kribbensis]